MTNFVEVIRQLDDTIVTVRATYFDESDTWRVSSMLNGAHHDDRTTTDIWAEIPDMIDCAFGEAR